MVYSLTKTYKALYCRELYMEKYMKLVTKKLYIMLIALLGMGANNVMAQNCIEPKDPEYFLLTISTYGQKYDIQKALLDKYCYTDTMRTKYEKGPFVMVSSKEGLINLEKKMGKQWADVAIEEQKLDMFSLKLLKNAETNRLFQENIKNTKSFLTKNFKNVDVTNINENLINNSRKELLDYLSDQYAKSFNINKDKKGNFALFYVISNNYPEYLTKALGAEHNKNLFLKKNLRGTTPLMAMFANELKGKNTEELSKKVINMVPVSYIINSSVYGYDYFQFAETFKNNNPYFYKELKNKFKFDVTKAVSTKDYKDLEDMLTINWFVDNGD